MSATSPAARSPAIADRLLVTDIGGVLLTPGIYLLLDELAEVSGREQRIVHDWFRDYQRPLLWSGGQRYEPTFWAEVVSALAPPNPDPAYWRQRLAEVTVPLPVGVDAVRRWAERVPVWLVSNNRRAWVEQPLRDIGIWQLTGRQFISDETGLVKPDPAAYRQVLDAWGGDAAAVLVVDDKAANTRAASSLGMATVPADAAGSWTAVVDEWLVTVP